MSGRLTGDFDKLARLQGGLEHLSKSGFRETMEGWADASRALLTEEFSEGHGPDGAMWKPTLSGNAPLRGKTGRLEQAATQVFATKHGIRINVRLVYAGIQQFGGWAGRGHATWIPPRPYLPSRLPTELPPSWESALHHSLSDVVTKHTR